MRLFCTFLVFLLAGGGAAIADTMIFSISQDATLYETTDGSESGGGAELLMVGRVGTNDPTPRRRSLLQFDLSALPAGATVTSATLTLELFKLNNASAALVNVHRVTSLWNAGTVNPPGAGGLGAAPSPGDATWLHRSSPTAWTTSGGDFLGVSSASQSVTSLGIYNWTGGTLAADVQAWAGDPSQNFGWILIGDESVSRSIKEFSSQDSASNNKPALTVNFTVVPEPGVAGLAAAGLVALIMTRRRK